MKEHAMGRLLAHYFDKNGNIIHPNEDSVLQASMRQLKRTQVIAVCSKQVKPVAVAGALRLGVIDTLILSQSLGKQLVDFHE